MNSEESVWPVVVFMVAVNIGAFLVCVAAMARHLIKISEYNRRLRKIAKLDVLLTGLCSQAFMQRHAPVFRAWAETMGTISVNVQAVRKEWSEG